MFLKSPATYISRFIGIVIYLDWRAHPLMRFPTCPSAEDAMRPVSRLFECGAGAKTSAAAAKIPPSHSDGKAKNIRF
ncbi:MAG: hypothetical protein KKG92_13645 [Gammaproteobacteria bacterium]|nr:hypothetical protein [Gammaproteobacteria bacterium]